VRKGSDGIGGLGRYEERFGGWLVRYRTGNSLPHCRLVVACEKQKSHGMSACSLFAAVISL
jgi:hypothetical protein